MASKPRKLLAATNNSGKLAELGGMLTAIRFELVSLASFPHLDEVAETGKTFAENAAIKASGYAKQAGLISLADDSGLEIAALDGRPGIYSARYGGDVGFDEKMALVLSEMADIHADQRRARFVCSIAIADASGRILRQAEGVCRGNIAAIPRGIQGFGYDPIFVPEGYDKTFGELSDAIKGEISHRARAFRLIIPFLQHLSVK